MNKKCQIEALKKDIKPIFTEMYDIEYQQNVKTITFASFSCWKSIAQNKIQNFSIPICLTTDPNAD